MTMAMAITMMMVIMIMMLLKMMIMNEMIWPYTRFHCFFEIHNSFFNVIEKKKQISHLVGDTHYSAIR